MFKKTRPTIPRLPCAGCGRPVYTLYCDQCVADLAAPARFKQVIGPTLDRESTQRRNGVPIPVKIRGGGHYH